LKMRIYSKHRECSKYIQLRLFSILSFLFFLIPGSILHGACIPDSHFETFEGLSIKTPDHCIRLRYKNCEEVKRQVGRWNKEIKAKLEFKCERTAIDSVHKWVLDRIQRSVEVGNSKIALDWLKQHVDPTFGKRFEGREAQLRITQILAAVQTGFSVELFDHLYPYSISQITQSSKVFQQKLDNRESSEKLTYYRQLQDSLELGFINTLAGMGKYSIYDLLEKLRVLELSLPCTFVSELSKVIPDKNVFAQMKSEDLLGIMRVLRPSSTFASTSNTSKARGADFKEQPSSIKSQMPNIIEQCRTSIGPVPVSKVSDWLNSAFRTLFEEWIESLIERLLRERQTSWKQVSFYLSKSKLFDGKLGARLEKVVLAFLTRKLQKSEVWSTREFSELVSTFGEDTEVFELMKQYINLRIVPKGLRELVKGKPVEWKEKVCRDIDMNQCFDLFAGFDSRIEGIIKREKCDNLVNTLIRSINEGAYPSAGRTGLTKFAAPIISTHCDSTYLDRAKFPKYLESDEVRLYRDWRSSVRNSYFAQRFDSQVIGGLDSLFVRGWRAFLHDDQLEFCKYAVNQKNCLSHFEEKVVQEVKDQINGALSNMSFQNQAGLKKTLEILEESGRPAWFKVSGEIHSGLRWMQLILELERQTDLEKFKAFHLYRLKYGHEGHLAGFNEEIAKIGERLRKERRSNLIQKYQDFLNGERELSELEVVVKRHLEAFRVKPLGISLLSRSMWEIKNGKRVSLELKVISGSASDSDQKVLLVPGLGKERLYDLRALSTQGRWRSMDVVLKEDEPLTFEVYSEIGKELGLWQFSFQELVLVPWSKNKVIGMKLFSESGSNSWRIEWKVPSQETLGFPTIRQLE
jgi:hypothetical protein